MSNWHFILMKEEGSLNVIFAPSAYLFMNIAIKGLKNGFQVEVWGESLLSKLNDSSNLKKISHMLHRNDLFSHEQGWEVWLKCWYVHIAVTQRFFSSWTVADKC